MSNEEKKNEKRDVFRAEEKFLKIILEPISGQVMACATRYIQPNDSRVPLMAKESFHARKIAIEATDRTDRSERTHPRTYARMPTWYLRKIRYCMNYHGGVASIMHSSLRESCENIDHKYEEFTAVFINETHTLLYFQALIDMPCKSCHLTP